MNCKYYSGLCSETKSQDIEKATRVLMRAQVSLFVIKSYDWPAIRSWKYALPVTYFAL